MGEERLHDLGFEDKVTAEQAVILNKAEGKLPSASDVDKADDIELQEIVENAARSIENLNQQVSTEYLPMRELLGLDKQLRSIRGSLKVRVGKKVQLEEHIAKDHRKLEEFRKYPGEYDDAMREDIMKRIHALNDELAISRSLLVF